MTSLSIKFLLNHIIKLLSTATCANNSCRQRSVRIGQLKKLHQDVMKRFELTLYYMFIADQMLLYLIHKSLLTRRSQFTVHLHTIITRQFIRCHDMARVNTMACYLLFSRVF